MTTQQDSVDVERVVTTSADRRAMEQWACMTVDLSFDPADAESLVEAFAKHRLAALSLPITQRDEQGDQLREALRDIMNHFGWQDRGPGHSHTVKGIWDADVSNGDRAGTTCEWCAKWENARRLSIEQGDQDGGTSA